MATWVSPELEGGPQPRVTGPQRPPGKNLLKNLSASHRRPKSNRRHYPNLHRTAQDPDQQQDTSQTDHSYAGDPHEKKDIPDHDLPTQRSAAQEAVIIHLISPARANLGDITDY